MSTTQENTMADLRREVAIRLRDALHGRQVDMEQDIVPKIPHMLGITGLGNVHDPTTERHTLMDPSHHFWEEYDDTVETKNAVMEKLESAISSLRQDEHFTMTHPYGEEAGVIYCEIDVPDEATSEETLQTSCKNCDTLVTTDLNLLQRGNSYNISVSIDCPDCGFSQKYGRTLTPL